MEEIRFPSRTSCSGTAVSLRSTRIPTQANPLACFPPGFQRKMEEMRFELMKPFRVYTLSKRAPSATRTLLQE